MSRPRPARSAPPADTVPELRQQLAQATEAALYAYRDTTRLIRLLSVLGQPAGPEELVDHTLTVLSEVFFAEVVVLTHRVGGRLVVVGACGLAEDDPAFQDGWPAAGSAAEALGSGQVVACAGPLRLEHLPGSLAQLEIRSAVWVPLAAGDAADDLLVLMRSSPEPFTLSDRQVLSSVAARLRLAVEERARSAVIEQLARYGPRLASQLELDPLLDEAVELLQQLTDADRTWVVTVDGGLARLRAHRGLAGPDQAGWPRPVGRVDARHPVVRTPPDSQGTAGGLADGSQATVLAVPVVVAGNLAAVLFAARERSRPFARDVPETTAIFANYLAVALMNAELYCALSTRATEDPLTGLANRTLASQRLERALLADDGHRVGLLFCDLDRFKEVNDLFGHEAGDELLRQVATRLRGCVRPGDLLARFGGDEFVVVLERARDLAGVAEVGRALTAALDWEFLVQDEPVRISVSVGGVLGTPGASTASGMLRDADAAMYVAKERGRGQVEVFDDDASQQARARLADTLRAGRPAPALP